MLNTRLVALVLIPLGLLGADMNKQAQKKIQIFNAETKTIEEVEPIVKSDAEWKRLLSPEQYEVLRRKGTERPFSRQCAIPLSGEGMYQCAACGQPVHICRACDRGNVYCAGACAPMRRTESTQAR